VDRNKKELRLLGQRPGEQSPFVPSQAVIDKWMRTSCRQVSMFSVELRSDFTYALRANISTRGPVTIVADCSEFGAEFSCEFVNVLEAVEGIRCIWCI